MFVTLGRPQGVPSETETSTPATPDSRGPVAASPFHLRRARLTRLSVVAATVAATVSIGASPLPVSAHASPATRACSGGTYTVVRGDGWSIIARKLGATTGALLSANGATSSTVIHPGRSVCVPAGSAVRAPAASPTTAAPAAPAAAAGSCANGTYTVVRGDGWSLIARKVGTTTKVLLSANRASTATVLHTGRSVCLPSGVTAPSSGAATPAPATVRAYTAAENEAIIRAVWPDELEEEALRIARRESNLQNRAKNACCHGLFQIHWTAHRSWLAGIGVTTAGQLLDPNVNAAAAYALYQRAGGFRPWAL